MENTSSSSIPKNSYQRFVFGQIVSLLGSEIVGFVLGVYLAQEYQNALLFAFSMILQFLPRVLISPLAGVWADKKNRKKIVILSDGLQAVVTTLLVILFTLNAHYKWNFWTSFEIWLIFGFIATRSVLQAVQGPSISSILPSITPKEKLHRLNATFQFASGIMGIIAPLIAATLIKFWPIYHLLWIDSFTFIVALLVILTVDIPQLPKSSSSENTIRSTPKSSHIKGFFNDLTEGVSIAKDIKGLPAFLFLFVLTNFLVTPINTLSELLIFQVHEGTVDNMAFIGICFSCGVILGSITALLIKKWPKYIPTLLLSIIGLFCGLFIVGSAEKGMFWLIGLGGFITTFGIPLFSTIASTVIQLVIPLNKMGRFSGFMSALISIFTPVGYLISGLLGEITEIPYVLMGASAIAIVSIILIWLLSPIMQLEHEITRKLHPSVEELRTSLESRHLVDKL